MIREIEYIEGGWVATDEQGNRRIWSDRVELAYRMTDSIHDALEQMTFPNHSPRIRVRVEVEDASEHCCGTCRFWTCLQHCIHAPEIDPMKAEYGKDCQMWRPAQGGPEYVEGGPKVLASVRSPAYGVLIGEGAVVAAHLERENAELRRRIADMEALPLEVVGKDPEALERVRRLCQTQIVPPSPDKADELRKQLEEAKERIVVLEKAVREAEADGIRVRVHMEKGKRRAEQAEKVRDDIASTIAQEKGDAMRWREKLTHFTTATALGEAVTDMPVRAHLSLFHAAENKWIAWAWDLTHAEQVRMALTPYKAVSPLLRALQDEEDA